MRDVKTRVRRRLLSLVDSLLEETGAVFDDQALRTLISAYVDRPSGMRRPVLIWATAQAYGSTAPKDAILQIAAATEMLHVFALIHDDRIDGDGARRGGSGASAALRLLAGDLLASGGYSLMGEIVARHRLDSRILADLRKAAARTVAGQIADISYLSSNPSFERLYEIYDAKTGWYTIAGPLRIGARLAGVADDEPERLDRVALPLGRAYQLRDDLTDLLQTIRWTRQPSSREKNFPPWELNLAATWLASRGIQRSPEPLLATIDEEWITSDVSTRVATLTHEAFEAAEALSLPAASRASFLHDLRDVLALPHAAELPLMSGASTFRL